MEVAFIISALLFATMFTTATPAPPLKVELVEPAKPTPETLKPIVISIGADGTIFLASKPITRDDLRAHLSGIDSAEKSQTRVFVRAHPTLAHGKTMQVMKLISAEGFDNIALVPGGNGTAVERGFGAANQQDD